jgi:hypothetical protein
MSNLGLSIGSGTFWNCQTPMLIHPGKLTSSLARLPEKPIFYVCPFWARGEQMDNITASASSELVVYHRNIALIDLALKCIAAISDDSQRKEEATKLLQEYIIHMLEKNNG